MEKKRYSLAVIPPMMLDSHRRSLRYHNENGLVMDPQLENKDAMLRVQYWSPSEIETFKERYLAHPKNFGHIANALENKVYMSTEVDLVLAIVMLIDAGGWLEVMCMVEVGMESHRHHHQQEHAPARSYSLTASSMSTIFGYKILQDHFITHKHAHQFYMPCPGAWLSSRIASIYSSLELASSQ